MKHAKPVDHDDDGAMRGIGLAVVAGLAVWVATAVAVNVATRSPRQDTQVASYTGVASDVEDDSTM